MDCDELDFVEGSRVVKGTSDEILVMIWITMLTIQPETRSLLNKL